MKKSNRLKSEMMNGEGKKKKKTINPGRRTNLWEQSEPNEDAVTYAEETADEEKAFPPEYLFTEFDPYFKLQVSSADRTHNIRLDEERHLHAKNLSAWRIPEIVIKRKIGGTVYTVTGSFDGEECMLHKLERISLKCFQGKEEGTDDSNE